MPKAPQWTTSIVRQFDHTDDSFDGTAARKINTIFADAARRGPIDPNRIPMRLVSEVRKVLDNNGFDGSVQEVTRRIERAVRDAG